MIDIVSRLRTGVYGIDRIPLCIEAADEIEILREGGLFKRDVKMSKMIETTGYNGIPLLIAQDKIISMQERIAPGGISGDRHGPLTAISIIGDPDEWLVIESMHSLRVKYEKP